MSKKEVDLFEILKQKGISVYKFSIDTGIPKDRVYQWKRGNGSPKAEDAKTIETYLAKLIQGKASHIIVKKVDPAEELGEINEQLIKMRAEIDALKLYVSEYISEKRQVSFADGMQSLHKTATEQADRIYDEQRRKAARGGVLQ